MKTAIIFILLTSSICLNAQNITVLRSKEAYCTGVPHKVSRETFFAIHGEFERIEMYDEFGFTMVLDNLEAYLAIPDKLICFKTDEIDIEVRICIDMANDGFVLVTVDFAKEARCKYICK